MMPSKAEYVAATVGYALGGLLRVAVGSSVGGLLAVLVWKGVM